MGRGDLVADLATGIISFSMRDGDLRKNFVKGPDKVRDAVYAIMEYYAPQVEARAKLDAPWHDQTGNARSGLAARPFRESDNMGIVLYHQVPYGIWLELRWSGRYATIMPTINQMGPEVIRRSERLLTRMRF